MKLYKILLIYFFFLMNSSYAQIQKGKDIVLEKSMQSIFNRNLHQLTIDGNTIIFGDKGTCKAYSFGGNDWKFESSQIISPSFLGYMQSSTDGKTVAALGRDTLKIFEISQSNKWFERASIPEFIFSGNLPEIELSPDGKTLAIHQQNELTSTSNLKIFFYVDSVWKLVYNNQYFTQYATHVQFDSLGKTLLFTNEYQNYVILIKEQNGVWQERKLFFGNESNQKLSQKRYTSDTKRCVELIIDICNDKNVAVVEYSIDDIGGIKEVRRQNLNICSNRYQTMSGDGNTLVFSNGDASEFTFDTVWVFKRGIDGYFIPFGLAIPGPSMAYDFGLGMNLDYDGNTLSVLARPCDLLSGLKTYIKVYDLSKTSSVFSDDAHSNSPIIYPNPTNGFIHIEDGWTLTRIYNANGTIAKDVDIVADSYDMSVLPTGIYFLQVSKNGSIQISKIFKM